MLPVDLDVEKTIIKRSAGDLILNKHFFFIINIKKKINKKITICQIKNN